MRQGPREVRIATVLLIALGTIVGLNGIAALFLRDRIAAAAAQDVNLGLTPGELSRLLSVTAVVLVVLGLLHVVAGVYVARGRQWARVLAFVVAGVVILVATVGALGGAGVLAVALLGAAVGVVSLLMQGSVGLWFAPRPAGPPLSTGERAP